MDLPGTFASQYLAALVMLEQTVQRCPAELWADANEKDQFWHIAYHALFYTHLYLQESGATFVAWPQHRPEYHFLGPLPWPPHRMPAIGEPYTRAEVLEFLAFCRNEVVTRLPVTDFEAASGFDWLPFDKLELQVYNLRHLHQHIGELGARLSARGILIDWIGAQPS
jgi:hypothetical protein